MHAPLEGLAGTVGSRKEGDAGLTLGIRSRAVSSLG